MNPLAFTIKNNSGFYFIPTYSPTENFYIRAAIEDPRPILDTKEFPGTSCNSLLPIIFE